MEIEMAMWATPDVAVRRYWNRAGRAAGSRPSDGRDATARSSQRAAVHFLAFGKQKRWLTSLC